MIETGTVFDVGNTGTPIQQSQPRTRTTTTKKKEQKPQEWENPVEAAQDLQTGVNEEAYYELWQNYDSFGKEMWSKGIDITSPDASNPDSILAFREAQKMRGKLELLGNELKVGKEFAKMYQTQRAQSNIVGPALQSERATTAADLNSLENVSTYQKELNQLLTTARTVAKEYNDSGNRDIANRYLNETRKAVTEKMQEFVELGLSPEVAQMLTQTAEKSISDAYYNDAQDENLKLKQKNQNLNERKFQFKKTQAKNESNGASRYLKIFDEVNNGVPLSSSSVLNYEDDGWFSKFFKGMVQKEDFIDGTFSGAPAGKSKEFGDIIYSNGKAYIEKYPTYNRNGHTLRYEQGKEVIPFDFQAVSDFFRSQYGTARGDNLAHEFWEQAQKALIIDDVNQFVPKENRGGSTGSYDDLIGDEEDLELERD